MVKLPRLRAVRERALLTQGEFGEKAGITQANLSKIERGGNARVSTARKLAKVLKVEPDELMIERELERIAEEMGR